MNNKELKVGKILKAPNGRLFTIAKLEGGAVFFAENLEQPLSAGWVLKGFTKHA